MLCYESFQTKQKHFGKVYPNTISDNKCNNGTPLQIICSGSNSHSLKFFSNCLLSHGNICEQNPALFASYEFSANNHFFTAMNKRLFSRSEWLDEPFFAARLQVWSGALEHRALLLTLNTSLCTLLRKRITK